MLTLDDVAQLADLEVLEHLDRQVDVPVLTAAQAQGDVLVLPAAHHRPATTSLPAAGVAVVRGENGGNTHHLLAVGPACWSPAGVGEQTLGALTVPAGAQAYLIHPEHGAAGIGPGTYLLRRQREQADEARLVAD